jgi:hypothetical protein
MKTFRKIAWTAFPALLLSALSAAPAGAQVPAAAVPVIVDTAAPIVVGILKPKPNASGMGKFEGYVMHANIAQITVRAKGNDLGIQTFPLSQELSAKMQTIVDKGGYQYGDKVTIYYDPTNLKALRIKGKPSKPV